MLAATELLSHSGTVNSRKYVQGTKQCFAQSKPIINCTLTPVLTSLLVQSGTTSFLAEMLSSELGIIVAAAIFVWTDGGDRQGALFVNMLIQELHSCSFLMN